MAGGHLGHRRVGFGVVEVLLQDLARAVLLDFGIRDRNGGEQNRV